MPSRLAEREVPTSPVLAPSTRPRAGSTSSGKFQRMESGASFSSLGSSTKGEKIRPELYEKLWPTKKGNVGIQYGIVLSVLSQFIPQHLGSTKRQFRALVLIFASWAAWEAVKFPRTVSIATPLELVKTLVQFTGDMCLSPLFTLLPGEKPFVKFQRTKANRRIVRACPSLQYFKQSAFFRNSSLAFLGLMVRDFNGNDPQLVRRERLQAKDGGIVALDWWIETELPHDAPLLYVGSTFSGDALNRVSRDICRHFASRGWRCATMVKRGCGLTMPNVQPGGTSGTWCLSGLEDITLGIDHIAAAYPGVPICGMGVSTGGAQLRNYVCSTGSASKLAACVVVDAAAKWEEALLDCDRRVPHISRVLFQAAEGTLVHCNHKPEEFLHDVGNTEMLGLFAVGQLLLGPVHGYEPTFEDGYDYLRGCTPAPASGCQRPLLEMNTFNDTLIDVPVVREIGDWHLQSPHVVTCSTRQGTHAIRWEGWRARCWMSRASCEFLEAALKEQGRAGRDSKRDSLDSVDGRRDSRRDSLDSL